MPELFADTSRFWVIFDTCTIPDYYLDVHKLLAIPQGATLRYNYRQKYLSRSAIAASLNPSLAPRFGLLLYAQRSGFRRGDGTPATGTTFDEMLWIPTRIVEMLCIPARDGETFNYDFKALRYPSTDGKAVKRVLDPLIQSREVPFNNWVTISSELGAFEDLQKGDDRMNWGSIVAEFHKPESQFSSDVFWRIIGPTKSRTSRVVSPRYERIFESGDLRLVKAVYDLEEGENHSFEIVSAGPPRSQGPPFPQYSVRCTSTNDNNLEVIGSGTIGLRQQGADSVQFVGKIAPEIADHNAALSFDTQPKPNDWPGGPELEVLVAIVKSRSKMVFGLIMGLLGLLLAAYGAEEMKSSTLTGIVCLAIGTCLLVISGLLIFRKLSLRG
jgi:hypothetical protein